MRISQVAFSADEKYLVLSAETGGGLAVYETEALLNGSTQSVFELPTNGQALRTLLPNPTPEKADLFAVVTMEGNLLIANLKDRSYIQGPNGQVLKNGVTCVAWSVKGKQLVAGLADGTVHQMTPEGVGKGDIPKPPNLNNGAHGKSVRARYTSLLIQVVSALFWLENTVFLTVHTPQSQGSDQSPDSVFNIVTKHPTDGFMFQKLIEPVGPFGMATRATPHHFMLRLKDYPPNLQDLIAVASTASTDIGLLTRSKVPLTNQKPAEKVTDVFTMTEMSDDSRRAQLPSNAELSDTSPIGFAFDFSSTEKILQPIPTDPEISESPIPLPLLTVLNNEGVLSAWWVVYNEAVRSSTVYPGMNVASSQAPQVFAKTTPVSAPSPFGASAPSNPFGSASPAAPAFGAPSAPGAFGAPSGLGQKASVWGAPSSSATQSAGSSFGTPAFGSASSLGSKPTFGSSALPGSQKSPWATGGTTTTSTFGQSSFGTPSQPFGSSSQVESSKPASSGGFASFASTGGFASAAQSSNSAGSVFGQKTTTSLFGTPAPATSSSPFGNVGKADSKPFGSNDFVLGSTFKADPSANDDRPPPSNEPKDSFFGGGFTNILSNADKPAVADVSVSNEADMDTGDDAKPDAQEPVSTTPTSTPAPPRFGSILNDDSKKPNGSGLFGSMANKDVAKANGNSIFGSSTPASKASAGFSFGKDTSTTPKPSIFGSPTKTSTSPFSLQNTTPSLSKPILPGDQPPSSTQIKHEPRDDPSLSSIPAAPLPPDTTSKDSYAAGDTSNSSTNSNDAPLPPDFVPIKLASKPVGNTNIPELPPPRTITADMLPPMDVPGGPSSNEGSSGALTEDEEGSYAESYGEDEENGEASGEGSGEDIANEFSSTSVSRQTTTITPSQSFGGEEASTSGDFFKIPAPVQTSKLFGEVQRSAPVLPPPKIMASPRSPSPVRSAIPGRVLRPEGSRSVSAPGIASNILGHAGQKARPAPKLDTVSEARIRAEIKAQQEAEEAQRLLDDQDDDIPRLLASELEPTPKLTEFIAHTDYVGTSPVESIPQQAESVYRDINSMVDTLGLNVRALRSFMLYQNQNCHEDGCTRGDLEDEESWVLPDLEALASLISRDLTTQLADGRLQDVAGSLAEVQALTKGMNRFRAMRNDLQRLLAQQQNDVQEEVLRSQPLSAEQTVAQHELRRKFTKFQTQLAQAEEALTTLKARIVSELARSGRGNSGPSSDAIKRTIAKMTAMAEKRSGDIDVLEGHVRNITLDSSIAGSARGGSPYATPSKNRASVNFGTASTSRFYTPDSVKDPRRSLRSSVMSTSGSPFSASPRKKLSGYTPEEKGMLKAKLNRRREVMDGLRSALAKSETRIRPLGDD